MLSALTLLLLASCSDIVRDRSGGGSESTGTRTPTTPVSNSRSRITLAFQNPRPSHGVQPIRPIRNAPIVLQPSAGFTSSGPVGGPFTPRSQAYTLTNTGPRSINYTRTVSQPWVTVSGPANGSLVSGQSMNFTVDLDPSATSSMPGGGRQALVEFREPVTSAILASIAVDLAITTGNPVRLDVVIADPNRWHTYPPGSRFSVDVRVTGDPLNGSRVLGRWVDAHRRPIGPEIPITTTATSIRSPSAEPGFYGLEFTSTNPDVQFLPQPAGWPSSVYGFAVIPHPPTGSPVVDQTAPFGLVQGNRQDPYLLSGSGPRVIGVHLKTLTWSQGTASWQVRIRNRWAAGHTEMPLISGSTWDSDDTQPISSSQLDAIGNKFEARLVEEPSLVDYWQVGREENGGSPYNKPHYFANLEAKMMRLRAEADPLNPNVKFVYSTRGRNMNEFQQLFASRPFGNYCAGLAQDPYWWPDFPMPEGWLVNHIRDLRTRMDAAGRTGHFLWFGEMGIPVRGTNDPNAFFGYPSSGNQVPGATLDYAASYMVKSHAVAIANNVGRIYWYNYQNRGNDVDKAEHHFGLRTYTGSSSVPGHPLPAYVAYINMLSHLKGTVQVASGNPMPDVFVFEYAVNGSAERRILAWVHPASTRTLPLTSLRAGLNAASVQSVVDLYGSPISVIRGDRISWDGRPIYLRF